FLDRATHRNPEQRFDSVADALAALKTSQKVEPQPKTEQDTGHANVSLIPDVEASTQQDLREEKVEWLLSLLQSYPGSLWGNRETRGLDTDFAAETYVETRLE